MSHRPVARTKAALSPSSEKFERLYLDTLLKDYPLTLASLRQTLHDHADGYDEFEDALRLIINESTPQPTPPDMQDHADGTPSTVGELNVQLATSVADLIGFPHAAGSFEASCVPR